MLVTTAPARTSWSVPGTPSLTAKLHVLAPCNETPSLPRTVPATDAVSVAPRVSSSSGVQVQVRDVAS